MNWANYPHHSDYNQININENAQIIFLHYTRVHTTSRGFIVLLFVLVLTPTHCTSVKLWPIHGTTVQQTFHLQFKHIIVLVFVLLFFMFTTMSNQSSFKYMFHNHTNQKGKQPFSVCNILKLLICTSLFHEHQQLQTYRSPQNINTPKPGMSNKQNGYNMYKCKVILFCSWMRFASIGTSDESFVHNIHYLTSHSLDLHMPFQINL